MNVMRAHDMPRQFLYVTDIGKRLGPTGFPSNRPQPHMFNSS
jgi:hypothetical protein